MPQRSLLVTLTIVSTLCTILLGPVTNFASADIPDILLPLHGQFWLVFLGLSIILAISTIWSHRLELDYENEISHPLSKLAQRNRKGMLDKVRSIWISGLLEHSLSNVSYVTVSLEERSDLALIPLNEQIQELKLGNRTIPNSGRLIKDFNDKGASLLILGEPGSGKTILLLELARDLLTRAEKDKFFPIPVIFNLSSWNSSYTNLSGWLIDELNTKYDIPRKLAKTWVRGDILLPLLDGLDEVKAQHRINCIKAINAFHEDNLVSLVVCSRSDEYMMSTNKLHVHRAIVLQPLTRLQIDEVLHQTRQEVKGLKAALEGDPQLYEFISSPLMLNIMMSIYQEQSEYLLPYNISPEEKWKQLLSLYVERMFARRGHDDRYSRDTACNWLAWLARQLLETEQSIFYLEELQPSCIRSGTFRSLYVVLTTLIGGFIATVVSSLTMYSTFHFLHKYIEGPPESFIGAVGMLFIGFGAMLGHVNWGTAVLAVIIILLLFSQYSVLFFGLFCGLLTAMLIAFEDLVGILRDFIAKMPLFQVYRQSRSKWSLGIALFGLLSCIGAIVGLATIYEFHQLLLKFIQDNPFKDSFYIPSTIMGINTVGVVIAFSLMVGVTGTLTLRKKYLIEPVESLQWSWKRAGKGLIMGLLLDLLVLLTFGYVMGSIFAAYLLLSSALFMGFRRSDIEVKIVPNQGTWRSIRYSFWIAALFSLTFSLVLEMFVIVMGAIIFYQVENRAIMADLLNTGLWKPMLYSISVFGLAGIVLGIPAGMIYGGASVIRHAALRLILTWRGAMPLNYVHFLDFCVDRIFLRRVGGGYIFIHRLLLEHFAAMKLRNDS